MTTVALLYVVVTLPLTQPLTCWTTTQPLEVRGCGWGWEECVEVYDDADTSDVMSCSNILHDILHHSEDV